MTSEQSERRCLLDCLVCQSRQKLSIAVTLMQLPIMKQQAACLTGAVAAVFKAVA